MLSNSRRENALKAFYMARDYARKGRRRKFPSRLSAKPYALAAIRQQPFFGPFKGGGEPGQTPDAPATSQGGA